MFEASPSRSPWRSAPAARRPSPHAAAAWNRRGGSGQRSRGHHKARGAPPGQRVEQGEVPADRDLDSLAAAIAAFFCALRRGPCRRKGSPGCPGPCSPGGEQELWRRPPHSDRCSVQYTTVYGTACVGTLSSVLRYICTVWRSASLLGGEAEYSGLGLRVFMGTCLCLQAVCAEGCSERLRAALQGKVLE